MRVLITGGPTAAPLDAFRVITNRSTGRLASMLAAAARDQGDKVLLLRSELCTHPAPDGIACDAFCTHESLREAFVRAVAFNPEAIWHAAAVGDFYAAEARDELGRVISGGKLPSGCEAITLILRPAPKILGELRTIFPRAVICGWKYEVDGDRARAVLAAREQLRKYQTHACVINGPAWGQGYGVLYGDRLEGCRLDELCGVLRTICRESLGKAA